MQSPINAVFSFTIGMTCSLKGTDSDNYARVLTPVSPLLANHSSDTVYCLPADTFARQFAMAGIISLKIERHFRQSPHCKSYHGSLLANHSNNNSCFNQTTWPASSRMVGLFSYTGKFFRVQNEIIFWVHFTCSTDARNRVVLML